MNKACGCPKLDSPKLQKLFLEALSSGDEAMIEKRLAQGACPRTPAARDGETPLMAAAMGGNMSMVKRLAPQSDILAVDKWGGNALAHLLGAGDLRRAQPEFIDCLKILAGPESAKAANSSGESPLMIACANECKFMEILEVLGPWSDWRAKDSDGMNLVAQSLDVGSDESALALWHRHPDKAWLAHDVDERGRTIAHFAAECDAAPVLLAIAGHVDFGARDHDGRTPLMVANLKSVNAKKTMPLLAQWSDCQAVDYDGCDALMLLIEGLREDVSDKKREILDELVNRADLGARDKLGESALEKARDRKFEKVASSIQSRMDIAAERDEIAQASSAEEKLHQPRAFRI